MKKFTLTEMMILSTSEKKAKRIEFDQRRTLIFGGNGTGKSCLIKSIYKTFGATPHDHPSWKALNPVSFIRFEVTGSKYSILKEGKLYAIFDGNDQMIKTFDSVTNGLGPFLSEIFDFKLKLPNQKGELITPPPAYLFMPYYVDQDNSWRTNWNSFKNLQQLKSPREPLAYYHTGIRPNEYYTTKGEIEIYAAKIKALEDEKKMLKNLLDKLKEQLAQADFNIDIEEFKEEIKELLIACEELKNKQEKLKSRLVDLYNSKIVAESQLTISKSALKESQKDYAYSTEILVEDSVDCPTCGAHYQNSFLERFEIAKDEDRCKELVEELTSELIELDKEILRENETYNRQMQEITRIEAILQNKKGEIKLKDVIENAGRNEVKNVFEENSKALNSSIYDNYAEKTKLDELLKSLTDKDRRKTIIDYYLKLMKGNLLQLDVNTLREDHYKKIDTQINETGSALPRALVAYYFSIFEVVRQYTSSVFCPIVIDSPNQQV